jgi:hypothetical protein
MSKKEAFLGLIATIVILAATIVAFTGFGNFSIAQGQANDTSSSSSLSLTPEQKDAICNPNNPLSNLNPVNTTESRICGIPVTIKPRPSNTTSAGTETSTGSLAPSVVPSPEEG